MIAAAHGESGNIAIGAGSLGNAKENVPSSGANAHTLDNNIGIGRNALLGGDLGTGTGVLTHQGNIAIGSYALDATAANPHLGTIAIGHNALTALTEGEKNTALGYQAGNVLTTGDENTIIGYDADVDDSGRHGCIVIGAGLSLNTADHNVVEIGNNTNSLTADLDSVSGTFAVTSDKRIKRNINDSNLGLNFINELRPVSFQMKSSSEYPKEFNIKKPSTEIHNKLQNGLIAQEVKEVMDDLDIEFAGWSEGINTRQRLNYDSFITPLIKAVQELSSKVEELEAKLSK